MKRQILLVALLAASIAFSFAQSYDPAAAAMSQQDNVRNEMTRLHFEVEDAQDAARRAKAAAGPTAKPVPKTAAELDEEARISAHVSYADWQLRKPENNAFNNGFFGNSPNTHHVAQEPLARVPDTTSVNLSATWAASGAISLRRYPQLADSNEAKLWLAADKLRSNMDAAEYKHTVLGLIFRKYISDKVRLRGKQPKQSNPTTRRLAVMTSGVATAYG